MRSHTIPNISVGSVCMSNAAVSCGADPLRAQPPQSRHAESARDGHAENGDHDDGLVHGHFWAMSSTVR